eukprot:SAG11_NODE_2971_length_2801_cov_2.645078_1_plen_64_part_00
MDELALQLQRAGVAVPVKLVLLHGWSPGPGLPELIVRSGLFQVTEVQASTVLAIVCNAYGAFN